MSDHFQFADTFGQLVQQSHYTPGQLAALSGIPKTTIVNWLTGRVRRPRRWQALIKLASALRLNTADTNALLSAAEYPAVDELLVTALEAERSLLTPWQQTTTYFPSRLRAPFQAIAAVPYFVGRQHELQILTEALLSPSAHIVTMTGMPGVGKTALAAQLATTLRDRFVDGVLWARVDASDSMSILSTFAAAYGRDVSRYADLVSRSRVVRDLLVDKQVLIILDNVPSSAAIEALLPPMGNCRLLITTQRHDLLVLAGGQRLHLEPFSQDSAAARALFEQILGSEWVSREAEMLAELAAALGYLPLALVLVAGRLAYEPGWSVADFVARLRQADTRLDEFRLETQSLRLSFDVSFELLTSQQQLFFTALGVFEGQDFADTAVAAITDTDLPTTQDRLRHLATLSLIHTTAPGRYHLHPLLRAYALEKASARQFVPRMVGYFVTYAETHTHDYAALTQEFSNMLAAMDAAYDLQAGAELQRGVLALIHFLQTRGRFDLAAAHLQRAAELVAAPLDRATVMFHQGRLARLQRSYETAATLLKAAYEIAQAANQPYLLSAILAEQGVLSACLGTNSQAADYFAMALPLARRSHNDEALVVLYHELALLAGSEGDHSKAAAYLIEGLVRARRFKRVESIVPFLRGLGNLANSRGDFSEAAVYFEEGLALARTIDDRIGSGSLLNNLGSMAIIQGQFDVAEQYFQTGLAETQTALGQHPVVAMLIANVGSLALERGDFDTAVTHFQTSLQMAQALHHQELIILMRLDLSTVARRRGQFDRAEKELLPGLSLAQKIGHRRFVGRLLNERGCLLLAKGELAAAQAVFQEALALIRPLEAQPEWAEALYGLAQTAAAQADDITAKRLSTEAINMLAQIRPLRAEEIRQWQNNADQ